MESNTDNRMDTRLTPPDNLGQYLENPTNYNANTQLHMSLLDPFSDSAIHSTF